ncbi:MAG: HD domain-containing protein [Candidatus Peribacteraceae bacterium]|nr:HD domain-containing protein [Candidatus Peribacteraceae bacterium]MDD5074398.1 HD domain-containing protein [Candidatus Peribacteraceae bacterium]
MSGRINAARLLTGLPPRSQKKVREVLAFAECHLSGMDRRSGDSYARHGLEVALALREATNDATLLSVALLHDVPLHPDGDVLLRQSPLSPAEQRLALRMHHLRRLHIDENTKDLDAFLAAFSADERLILLRMVHRLNDVRHLRVFSVSLRRRIAHETLHMYTAVAGRLGMHAWRTEMEDICFRFLHPRIARSLERKFAAYRSLDRACLRHVGSFLRRKMRKHGLQCVVGFRIKGHYSTYRKMILKDRRFEELTDRLALRIIVENSMDCYKTLAIVHGIMHPIPGKLKDYIGAPKENGYRSIHTVVFPLRGVSEQPIEIQIRTGAMHRICEFGLAAHGEYKNLLYTLDAGPARVDLLRNLESLREEARSPGQFEQVLRHYFRDDHLVVFDSSNNLFHLKSPATALDFVAFSSSREISCLKQIRVNGRKLPFGTLLKSGDTVEASFGGSRTIMSTWSSYCRHHLTQKRIRAALRGS